MIAGRGRFQVDAGMLIVTAQKQRLQAAHCILLIINVFVSDVVVSDVRTCVVSVSLLAGGGK